MSPSGCKLASGGYDGYLHAYDAKTGFVCGSWDLNGLVTCTQISDFRIFAATLEGKDVCSVNWNLK